MKTLFFKIIKISLLLVPLGFFFFFKEEPMLYSLPQSENKIDLPDKTNEAFKPGEVYKLDLDKILKGTR